MHRSIAHSLNELCLFLPLLSPRINGKRVKKGLCVSLPFFLSFLNYLSVVKMPLCLISLLEAFISLLGSAAVGIWMTSLSAVKRGVLHPQLKSKDKSMHQLYLCGTSGAKRPEWCRVHSSKRKDHHWSHIYLRAILPLNSFSTLSFSRILAVWAWCYRDMGF